MSDPKGIEMLVLPNPFEGLTDEQKEKAVKQLAEHAKSLYERSLDEICEKIIGFEPLQLLSMCAFYGLSSFVREGDTEIKESKINQNQVELLQGLILRIRYAEFAQYPVLPEDYRFLTERLKSASDSSTIKRIGDLAEEATDEERHRASVLEFIRTHTQIVRNWGYPSQVFETVKSLVAPLEDDIESELGIRLESLLDMFMQITNEIQERVNEHWRKLRRVWTEDSTEGAARVYHEVFDGLTNSVEETIEFGRSKGYGIEHMRTWLTAHSDMRLSSIYTFCIEELLTAYPKKCDRDKLEHVFNLISLSFGALDGFNRDHLFLGNPVWESPFIALNDGQYFIPIPGLFVSFAIEVVERILQENNNLFKRYEKYRGEFLENEAEIALKNLFPSAEIYRGNIWKDSETGKEFENDILVIIDSYMIVVEAKSGKIAGSARRGGTLRLKSTVNNLIIDASEQSARFAAYLANNKGEHEFSTKDGRINKVDNRGVIRTIRLNVTLDLLSGLSSGWPELQAAGFIPKDLDVAPTISLAELEIVSIILEDEVTALHYLVRRAAFEVNAQYHGDEIDLLAFYLKSGLNVGEAEFDNYTFALLGESELIDPYFMQDIHGVKVDKPELRLSQLWKDILQRIEKTRPHRWTELGHILLNFDYDGQIQFELELEEFKRKAASRVEDGHPEDYLILQTGPPQRRDAIAVVSYRESEKDSRFEKLELCGGQAIIEAESEKAVVLGLNIDKHHFPYSVIAVFERQSS